MSKQTAVKWLIKELKDLGYYTYNLEKLCEQAKQMEKEQIVEAHGVRQIQGRENGVDFWQQITGEEFYKEQYERKDN